jgi:hypothetical protein
VRGRRRRYRSFVASAAAPAAQTVPCASFEYVERSTTIWAEQRNFDTHTPPYIVDAPVDVHIVASTEKRTGCGEPPVPVIPPAVANALATLTGKHYRSLPLVTLQSVILIDAPLSAPQPARPAAAAS